MPSVPELHRVAKELTPCLILTPVDCYWEGSILQAPDIPINPVNTSTCLNDSPSGYSDDGTTPANVDWGNLNPDTLRQCLTFPESGFTPFVNAVRILCMLCCNC